ncbi:MAG: hypothetical protein QGI21_02820 [Candidatus Poseidoniaceae archaeon]|jgi:hypothetical protein|nr:hypothetical protein [Candidatus Poseidoniaceae archaeon]
MPLWLPDVGAESIHLVVEGSCGGTTLGLQISKQVIEEGGRVLWASPELPDGVRFGQIFSELDPVSSSRYHAINLVGEIKQSLENILSIAKMLPNVKLVVVDDYCPDTGRIPSNIVKAINNFVEASEWCTIFISKGGVSMDDRPLIERSGKNLNIGETWLLTRPDTDNKRIIHTGGKEIKLTLDEDGYKL